MTPKDRQIIIETDLGTYVAIWNETNKEFIYANLCIGLYLGEWNDTYFENEYIKEDEILKWREII